MKKRIKNLMSIIVVYTLIFAVSHGKGSPPEGYVSASYSTSYRKDVSLLKCWVTTSKSSYMSGEPIFVRLNSISEVREATIFVPPIFPATYQRMPGRLEDCFWLSQQFTLSRLNDGNVSKTFFGEKQIATSPPNDDILRYTLRDDLMWQISNKAPTSFGALAINQLFDLSEPGIYQFTVLRYASLLCDGKPHYDPPLPLGPISFHIKNGPPFQSSGLKEPGTWGGVMEKPFEYFDDLPPSGDYSKLKYVLRTNKTKYKEAEPVFLRLFLKNESEETIHVCIGGDPGWTVQSWSLVYRVDEALLSILSRFDGADPAKTPRTTLSFIDRYDQITREGPRPKLRLGQLHFPDVPRAAEVDWVFEKPGFVKLEPGEEAEMEPGEVQLNLYYDLSSPGKYVLKCQRSTVIPSQKFDSPLESNEVEFEVVQGSHFIPSDLIDPGNFDNLSEKL